MKILKGFLNLVFSATLAGVLIALAGIIFLNCENKIVGAFLFSVGLYLVIVLKASLYTGKIGYCNTVYSFYTAFLILIINLLTAYIIGLIYKNTTGISMAMATRLAKTWYRIFCDGILCGMLIYGAVEGYKKTNNPLIIVLCVMGFILGGTEHVIADAFYFGAYEFSWKAFGYIWLIALGNSIGSLLLRGLQLGFQKVKKDEVSKTV